VTAKIPTKGKTYSKDHLKGGSTTYGKDIRLLGKAKSKEVWVKITRQEYEGLKETIDLLADQQMRAVCVPPWPKPRLAS